MLGLYIPSLFAVVFLIATCRYAVMYKTFRIFEHLMMAGGAASAFAGMLILPAGVVGLFLGGGLSLWGLALLLEGQIQIMGNLKWRQIKGQYSRKDLLLMRWRSTDATEVERVSAGVGDG